VDWTELLVVVGINDDKITKPVDISLLCAARLVVDATAGCCDDGVIGQ